MPDGTMATCMVEIHQGGRKDELHTKRQPGRSECDNENCNISAHTLTKGGVSGRILNGQIIASALR